MGQIFWARRLVGGAVIATAIWGILSGYPPFLFFASIAFVIAMEMTL